MDLKPRTVLEVGIGNRTASDYFRRTGLEVTTCDIDRSKEPDRVADIRWLPFEDDAFDVVMAFEVLEHIPWSDLDQALGELCRTTKRHVVISVPHAAHHFEVAFKFPLIRKILKRDLLDGFFRIPIAVRDLKNPEGGHHWEIGRRSYPIKKFIHLLRKRFRIVREARPILNQYHHFFVLEKSTLSRET